MLPAEYSPDVLLGGGCAVHLPQDDRELMYSASLSRVATLLSIKVPCLPLVGDLRLTVWAKEER